jgi:hypothetical protein
MISVCYNGNIENMKWLKYNNCPIDEYSFECSIHSNKLSVIKWLIDNDCPYTYDSDITLQVIENGNLDILKYLRSIGYKFNDPSLFNKACEQGNTKILDWLKDINCPYQYSINWLCFNNKVKYWLITNKYVTEDLIYLSFYYNAFYIVFIYNLIYISLF